MGFSSRDDLVDNGPLDLDSADGKIIDPAGLGVRSSNNSSDSNEVVKNANTGSTGAPNTGLEKVNSWIYALVMLGGILLAPVAYLLHKRTYVPTKK